MTFGAPSPRAHALAAELRAAAAALIAVVARMQPEPWAQVRKPGEWSPGKHAEHVADAAAMHLWHVCRSLGVHQPGPPAIERGRLTPVRSQAEVLALLHTRAEEGARLVERLTDAQLDLAAKPARQPPKTVADVVARPLISHFVTHRRAIELTLRPSSE